MKNYNNKIFTKSGLIQARERNEELFQVMDDLRCASVDFLTLGQHLQPTEKHFPIKNLYHLRILKNLKKLLT